MLYKLIGSKLAEKTFNPNLEYLEKYLPSGTTNKFLDKVENVFYILKKEPYTFPFWKESYKYQRVVIVKK